MRPARRAVFAGICILFFLITIISASAANPVEFVNPRTYNFTMYDSQATTVSYTLKNLVNVTLTDCELQTGGFDRYIKFEPDTADIAPGDTRKFNAKIEQPAPGVHQIIIDVKCSNEGFSFDADGYSPQLLLDVRNDPDDCNIEITRPVSRYISFIGLNGTYSGSTAISVKNTDVKADNFTFAVKDINCNLSDTESRINGQSQLPLEVSRCLFENGDQDGNVVITSSKCDTAVNVRLSNSMWGHYFGLVKRYAGWIVGGIAAFIALIILLLLIIPKIFKG